MSVVYDVLLKQQNYKPVTGYYGEPKYTCIFYDEDRSKALKEMQKYVKDMVLPLLIKSSLSQM